MVNGYTNNQMLRKPYLNYARLAFGLLGLSAVVTEVAVLTERGVFAPQNFFSYFTILSNIAAAVFLILYSRSSTLSRQRAQQVDMIRGAITLYMAMTGVIFAVLLANIEGATLTAVPWDNLVLHYIMPIVVLLDWLVNPPTYTIRFRQAITWLTFPLIYVAYSLLRGPIANWYPYPFLDPTTSGYGQIFATSVVLLVGILVAAWLLAMRTGSKTATK